MGSDHRPKPLRGEVLPPVESGTELAITPPLRGVPLFSRMRYEAVRKEIVAYTSAVDAAADAVRARVQLANQVVAWERALVRVERLDHIRATAELEVEAELLSAAARLHALTEDASLTSLRDRTKRATLEEIGRAHV